MPLRLIPGIFGILAVVLPASAQITITSADVAATLALGNTVTSMTDTMTHTADIGQPGATSWDFSNLHGSLPAALVSVRPDTTPFFSYFPGSTHAQKLGSGGVGTFYIYYELGQNLLLPGSGMTGSFEFRSQNVPEDIAYELPMTLGTTWTSTFVDSMFVTNPPVTTVSNQVVNNTVDAYGSLTLPGGMVVQALRLKTDRRVTTSTYSNRTIFYNFLAANGLYVGVLAADTLQPTSGTIDVASISWASMITTGVPLSEGLPSDYVLMQNYPNPFNPTTRISYSLPEQAHVVIRIYNLLGQELATLVDATEEAGYHDAVWDASPVASGMYLYRIEAVGTTTRRSFIASKSMLLVR